MSIRRLSEATTALAASVGPRATLAAMDELAAALGQVDELLADPQDPEGEELSEELVIDLRAVLGDLVPVLSRAEGRIADIQTALEGR